MSEVWTVTYANAKRDLDLLFAGDRMDVVQRIEAIGKDRGWTIDIDVFTDQVDAYRLVNSRRRRWLIVMA